MMTHRDTCTIESGPLSMTIHPQAGGRVISFRDGGFEFLTGKEIHPTMYGSTFWSSPQSLWDWPPPPVLDGDPYRVIESGKRVHLESGVDPLTGFQFEKEFAPAANNWVRLSYTIVNRTGTVRNAAPWEISRVRKGGLFFFPLGEGTVGKKRFDPVPAEVIDGLVRYQDGIAKPPTYQLSIADASEGWMAYASGGKMFIKAYRDTPSSAQAPGEAEALVYASPEADYIEIEVQGGYGPIPPRGKTEWSVFWTIIGIPRDVPVPQGTTRLATLVRNHIHNAPPAAL